MAKKGGRNTYQIQDLLKDGGVKGRTPTPKISYIDWFKRGGWKGMSKVVGVVLMIYYVRYEMRDKGKRESYAEARMIMDQGIKPTEPVNKNLLRDDEQHQFGQSMLKEDKIK